MTMRILALVLGGTAALIGSCAPNPEVEQRARQRTDLELKEALAGYTAGKPVDCIPSYRSVGLQIIDDETLLYRDGKTIYLQKTMGRCHGIANSGYTLVTKQYGSSQFCRGDINQTVDLRTGMNGGACVFGDFVPYTKP